MKKLILILLLISSAIYAQFGRSQYFRKLGNDSLGLGYGLTKLKIDSMIYLRNAGFRFFNNQLQFSNDLLNWYNIPTSLPQGGGWTLGLNKIYQTTTNTPVHIRTNAGDTTGTGLLNIYGMVNIKGVDNSTSNYALQANGFSNVGLVVRNDGRVGIGTTNPSYSVDINGGSNVTPLNVFSTGSASRIRLATNDGSGQVYVQNGNIYLYSVTNGKNIYLETASGIKLAVLDGGNVGIGTTNPTSKLHIIGSTGYNQLRLQTPYTPTGSSDANGNVGDISWDDNYIYVKTSQGWKRAQLSNF